MSFQQSATPLLVERPSGTPLDLLSSASSSSSPTAQHTHTRINSSSGGSDNKSASQWTGESGGGSNNGGAAVGGSSTGAPTAAAAGGGGGGGGNSSSSSSGAAAPAAAATPIDQRLRTNIQIIRTNLLAIQENLGNLNRRLVSRRIVEGLHDRLRETYEVVLSTERLFKIWKTEQQQQQQTLDPLERQRMRFLYEKLSSHFQEEIRNVQEISERVREAAERVAGESSNSSTSSSSVRSSTGATAVSTANNSRSVGGTSACGGSTGPATTDHTSPLPRGGAGGGGEGAPAGGGGRIGTSGSHSSSSSVSNSNNTTWGSRRREKLEQQLSGKGNSSNKPSGASVLDLEDIAMVGGGDDDPDFFLNDDEQELCSEMEEVAEHESLLQRVVAEERYRGLQRIQGQVKQANQIFRDLAQLVLQQDAGVEAIDTQMQTTHSHVKGAATELYKAHQMQRRSRLRRCLLLVLVFVILSFLMYFYSPFGSVRQHAPATPADNEAILLQQKQQQDAVAAEESNTAVVSGRGAPTYTGAVAGLGEATGALGSLSTQNAFGTRFVAPSAATLPRSLDATLSGAPEAPEGPNVAYASNRPANLDKFIQTRMPSAS